MLLVFVGTIFGPTLVPRHFTQVLIFTGEEGAGGGF
jgi:hypothetical protein